MGRPTAWMAALNGRSPMKSPGAPSHRREVEREFWREIANGLLPEEAAHAVGGRRRWAVGGFDTVAACPRLILLRCPAAICRFGSGKRSRSSRWRVPVSGRLLGSWARASRVPAHRTSAARSPGAVEAEGVGACHARGDDQLAASWGPTTGPCRGIGKAIWCATRRCVTERRWKTFAVVLSQQRNEAGGSLIREMSVRVASSPDNAGTVQHYRMVRVRQARQEGVREEPVF